MKRFYGAAIFEEEEVADSAFAQLQNIRGEETRRIEYYNTEFKMQIDELKRWRVRELADIDTNAYNQIDTQNRRIAQCYREIDQIKINTHYAIADVHARSLIKFHIKLTHDENAEVARIEASAAQRIAEQNRSITNAYRQIDEIKSERIRLIAQVHRDFAIEYNTRLTRRDKDIAWAHSDATAKIAAVIARRYYVPIFMMRCAKGPCEFCRAKYGTVGTRDELEKLECIPPFHDDCRCWLEEIGYVVMTR